MVLALESFGAAYHKKLFETANSFRSIADTPTGRSDL